MLALEAIDKLCTVKWTTGGFVLVAYQFVCAGDVVSIGGACGRGYAVINDPYCLVENELCSFDEVREVCLEEGLLGCSVRVKNRLSRDIWTSLCADRLVPCWRTVDLLVRGLLISGLSGQGDHPASACGLGDA